LYAKIGKESPFHSGAGAKLLLAYMDEKRQKDIIENIEFIKFTDKTIKNKSELKHELNIIRKNSYSMSVSEQELDTVGVAYPIRDHTGKVIASLTVAVPESRFTDSREKQIKEK